MIHLYTWTTPNGRKPSIMLEECGLPYVAHPVDIMAGQQFEPRFLSLSPNNKIPAIIDEDGVNGPVSIFESGAILTYLAEKTGRFLPVSVPERYKTLEWLHWQVGGLGPMLGQVGFFAVRSPEKDNYAIKRFVDEADRLLGVMERRLESVPYLAGQDYSIADIACYPWIMGAKTYMQEPLAAILDRSPNIHRWLAVIGERPAVQRGMLVPSIEPA